MNTLLCRLYIMRYQAEGETQAEDLRSKRTRPSQAWMQRRLVGSGRSKGPDSRWLRATLFDQALERHTPFAHGGPQLQRLRPLFHSVYGGPLHSYQRRVSLCQLSQIKGSSRWQSWHIGSLLIAGCMFQKAHTEEISLPRRKLDVIEVFCVSSSSAALSAERSMSTSSASVAAARLLDTCQPFSAVRNPVPSAVWSCSTQDVEFEGQHPQPLQEHWGGACQSGLAHKEQAVTSPPTVCQGMYNTSKSLFKSIT